MLHSLPQHMFIPNMCISYTQSYKLFYFIMDQDSNKHFLYSASFTNFRELKKSEHFQKLTEIKTSLIIDRTYTD